MTDEEQIFELNYLFEEKKNIFQSLNYINSFYQTLYEFDKLVLRHIYEEANLEYSLVDLEYGSFKTKAEQFLKSIPDDLLKKPDLKTLVGLLLIKLKYWLIQKLSENKEITSKDQIQEISKKINKEIVLIGKRQELITTEVSDHSVLNVIAEISSKANNLKEKEAFEYKSKFGNAILRKGTTVNKPKILNELGSKTEVSTTTEIVKPKKIDLLSDESSWNCILNGKTVPIKISDKEWLEKYHNRGVNIESGDSLKVKLLIKYTYNPEKPKTKPSYEIVKVEGIIKPQENNEQPLL